MREIVQTYVAPLSILKPCVAPARKVCTASERSCDDVCGFVFKLKVLRTLRKKFTWKAGETVDIYAVSTSTFKAFCALCPESLHEKFIDTAQGCEASFSNLKSYAPLRAKRFARKVHCAATKVLTIISCYLFCRGDVVQQINDIRDEPPIPP